MKNISLQVKHLLVLYTLWIAGMLFVGVEGNFPLNDDWAYGKNVFHLTENGEFRLSDWPAMIFVAQMLWGAFFCKIFGFSFTILRISTLVVGLMGITAFYKLNLEVTRQYSIALFMSLLLLVNPYFFSLSYSFMTDVPFLSCAILSVFFFAKAIKYNKQFFVNFLLGTIFLVIATMIRQLGLLLAVFFLFGYLIRQRFRWESILWGILPLLVTIGIMFSYLAWLKSIDQVPEAYSQYGSIRNLFNIRSRELLKRFQYRPAILVYHLGWFFLPVICLMGKTILQRIKQYWWAGLLGIIMVIYSLGVWDLVPKGGVVNYLDIGGLNMKGAQVFAAGNIPDHWALLWFKLSGLISGLLLIFLFLFNLYDWIRGVKKMWENPAVLIQVGALVVAGSYFAFLILEPFFFDRYFIFFLPLLGIGILPVKELHIPRYLWVLGGITLTITAWFSLSGTHDLLERNRMRWAVLEQLTEGQGVAPGFIDGGFEFNSWKETYARRVMNAPDQPSWWFVDQDEFVVTVKSLPNFEVAQIFPYRQYIPFHRDSIYLLKRPTPQRVDTISTSLEKFSKAENFFYSDDGSRRFSDASQVVDTISRSGKHSVRLDKDHAFALTLGFRDEAIWERYRVKVWLYGQDSYRCKVVFATKDAEYFYRQGNYQTIKEAAGWELTEFEMILPDTFLADNLNFYLWYNGDQTVFADDLEIIRMKY